MGRNIHKLQEDLDALLESGSYCVLNGKSGAGACLPPLLDALGWRGEARHLIESLPHFEEVEALDDLRAVLARLNYQCQPSETEPARVTPQQMPCLLVSGGNRFKVLLSREDDTVSLFDAASGRYDEQPAACLNGTLYPVSEIDPHEARQDIARYGWMPILLARFRGLFVQLLILTFVSNLFALAVPVYVMNVYDKVIGTRSTDTLFYFLAGIGIVIGADMVIRAIRARGLAYLGARFDTLIGAAAFQQLLHLPVSMSERAPIGSQITRLKQFDGIRDIFTGTVAAAILDLPFAIIFITAIFMIGGAIAAVPVSLIAIYAIMALITVPLTNFHIKATGAARAQMQNFIIELVSRQREISESHAQAVWLERYRKLSEDTSRHHFRSQQLTMKIQTITQSLVMVAGVATLALGALMVMNDAMTIGVLIAVMAFVWKVLSPIQAIFLSLNRLNQAVQSFRQVNYLMRMSPERLPGIVPSFYRRFVGSVALNRVSFRYGPRAEPALMGVSLDIPAGQIVAIAGASGAGKSTLLRIIAGLYLPQAGSVHVDGLDIRQLDMGELRHAIAYVPQNITLFHGTVAQNVRLAQPTATFEQVRAAAKEATLQDYCECLPERLDTRLTAKLRSQLPTGLEQRIMLARAYVKNAPIYLLDEPANNLDNAGDAALMKKLESLRGAATVIMVTHRPSHMKLADRLVFMRDGQIVHDAAPEQVLPLIFPPSGAASSGDA